MKKINMNFDPTLLETIDQHAKDRGLNRTQFITFVLLAYFERLERKEKN